MENRPDWLLRLNPQQMEAVVTTDGPLLILSGAGTGKTRVLTSKIAYILHEGLAKPWEILAVTFTNKAAKEMANRVRELVGGTADSLWIGTFHSVGLRILKQYTSIVGLSPGFVILDEDDQKKVIKKIIVDELHLDPKILAPAVICEVIARHKDRGFYEGAADVGSAFSDTEFTIYKLYQKRLLELNAVDFADLLLLPLQIFLKDAKILEDYQRKFRYILVDEYQDTNAVQYKLLKMLSGYYKNLACVGDDDQSIYSWRGADIDNILKFERDFEGATVVRLETNYRSVPAVLAAASGVISHNQGRLGKTLHPCSAFQHETGRVKIFGMQSGLDEASSIISHIQNYNSVGIPYDQMAVLVRSGYQTRLFEDKLMHRGIPYQIVGGTKFYDRQEIKDIIGYLRLVIYPHDDLSFERVLAVPKRGLGDKVMIEISEIAKARRIPYSESAFIVAAGLKGAKKAALETFNSQFKRWREEYNSGDLTHYEFVRKILDESGYIEMWKNSKKEEGEARIQNINEFLGMLKSDYESIAEFLEYITLFASANENFEGEPSVSLMTMHAAKGLEFDAVFLPSWEQGIFPNEKAMHDTSGGGLEEERRLAYVSITRAKKHLEIYFASSRQVFGSWQRNMPSIFLGEIPAECIEYVAGDC